MNHRSHIVFLWAIVTAAHLAASTEYGTPRPASLPRLAEISMDFNKVPFTHFKSSNMDGVNLDNVRDSERYRFMSSVEGKV